MENVMKKQKRPESRVVRRRCKVCEWEGQIVELAGEDPDCPWCHAPTEITSEVSSAASNAAAALGRLGGAKGGIARAAALSARRRREIAAKAARARWGAKKK
jgi:hypothetical protein